MASQAEAAAALNSDCMPMLNLGTNGEEEAYPVPQQKGVKQPLSGTFSTLSTRGGVYLGIRYGLGVLISIGNMFVLTWWIGPHAYGIFVTVIGLTAFLGSLTRSGVDTYLVRRAAEPEETMYHVASTLIFACSIILVGAGVAAVPWLVSWYGSREFVLPYVVMLLTVPLVGLAGPPTAKLERALNFRAVAQIELGSQVLALMVSLALAWRGLGVWAPVCGHLAWQLCGVIAASRAARFVPRVRFNTAYARQMLSFGVGYTASLRTWQLRTLVNPLLVGRFAGAEGVAFVGLAIRVAEGLGFIRIAAARLAIAALARLQADTAKFRYALEQALKMQVLVLGPLLCAFALLGPIAVPRLMGLRWLPSLQVYPFVAAGVLVNSVFNLQASALFVVGEQWVVLKAYGSHVALLALGTLVLIPRFGLAGYGWADLAACAGYLFLQAGLSRVIGISHRKLLPWAVAFTAPLFAQPAHHAWSAVLYLPLLAMLIVLSRRWGAASGVKRFDWKSGLRIMAKQAIRRSLTFFLKAQQRGLAYVSGVLKYEIYSRSYRFRLRLSQLLRPGRSSQIARYEDLTSSGGQGVQDVFHFASEDISAIVCSVPAALQRQIITEAEKLLEQRFCFRGIQHDFPSEVLWQECPNGNISWNWDLNRHRFLLTLGTACYYSGETKYHTKLIELWEHWIDHNPVGSTACWKHPFEVAARLQNWIWAYFLLERSGNVAPARLSRLRSAIRDHGVFLSSNLEYHWPNNHLLLEAKALYEYALLFPHFRESSKLLNRAKRVLEREVLAQVLPDGAHSELSSMYHRIVAGELGELVLLSQKLGRPLPPGIKGRIAAMAEFTRALLRSDGTVPLLGDSALDDVYMRFDPAQRECSDLNYWVSQGDVLSFSQPSARLPELHNFLQAGYSFIRDATRDIHLTFDFGHFSQCPAANHAHCDALSFELYVAGKPLIVDPGIYLPWGQNGHWSQHFRTTGAHNTLMVDGNEQSELSRYCDVGRTARSKLISHSVTTGGAALTAECVPYGAPDGGLRHQRQIRYDRSGLITIHDEVEGSGRHRLDWTFQFAPEVDLLELADGAVLARLSENFNVLRLELTGEQRPLLAVVRGQTDPLRGWVSRNSAQVVPACAALYAAEVELPFSLTFQLRILC